MRIRKFLESTGYQNIEIDGWDDFTSQLDSIEEYEPFSEKEVRRLVEYFLQYVTIGKMGLFNNFECGGEDIDIYGLTNHVEYIYDVGNLPSFLVKEPKPGFTILITKAPDDWYYVSTDYNDDVDTAKYYKFDQMGGLFHFFESELGGLEKRDIEREKLVETIRKKLNDLQINVSEMSKENLREIDRQLDIIKSKLKK